MSDTAWDDMVLDCPELEELGPALQDIIVHLEMQGRSGTFECRVAIQYKFEDGAWSIPAGTDVVLSTVNTDGYAPPSAAFSDRTRLGRRRIRLVLQYHAATGGAVGNRAAVRVGVACRPFCC